MSKVFTAKQFVDKCKWLVNDVPNVYHSGKGWSELNSQGKWQFDCVVSIKSLLWGFKADKNLYRGGTKYCSNDVADFTCNGGLDYCTGVSTNFNNLVAGEYLCMKGSTANHSGIYLGNNQVFECTTGWGTKKCIISTIDKYGNRYYNGVKNIYKWTYHGKLNYIDYNDQPAPVDPYKERVKQLQTVLNQQYNCGLAVDGSFGPATTRACMNNYLYYGKKAPIHIKWMQGRLVAKGYSVGSSGIDGSFGPATRNALINFQRDKGLEVDAKCGAATSKKLVE